MGEIPAIDYDEITREVHAEVEASHSQIIAPTEEEKTESSSVDKEEKLDPEKRKSFAEKSFDFALNMLKRPSKKARIILGVFTFLAGAGYWRKDELLDWGAKAVMQNPYVMRYVESHFFSAGHAVSEDKTLSPDKVTVENDFFPTKDKTFELEVGDNNISVYSDISGLVNAGHGHDIGEKNKIDDFYLKNILGQNNNFVKEAENEKAFRNFLKEQIGLLTKDSPNNDLGELFREGDIKTFIDLVFNIVDKNLKYDGRTEKWLKPTDDGRLSLRWPTEKDGRLSLRWKKSNPLGALFSTNGMPVDQLLMGEHHGSCRQFSDSMILVAKEIKEMYPDKYQNIYITSFFNSYRWHVYNLVFVARSPKELDAFEIEPQTGSTGAPAYELIKMLKDRNIITDQEYLNMLNQFAKSPKAIEDNEDVYAMIEAGKEQNRPDVVESAKKLLLRQSGINDLQFLLAHEIINESEYADGIVNLLGQDKLLGGEIPEEALAFAKENPKESRALYSALHRLCLDPQPFKRLAVLNFFDLVDEMRNRHLLSDEEYFIVGKRALGEFESASIDQGKYVDFLLTKKEYWPIARSYLMRDLRQTVGYPIDLVENFGKGEYRSWTKKEALTEPVIYRQDALARSKKQCDRYEELTGEDLVHKTEVQFQANMAMLRLHLERIQAK